MAYRVKMARPFEGTVENVVTMIYLVITAQSVRWQRMTNITPVSILVYEDRGK